MRTEYYIIGALCLIVLITVFYKLSKKKSVLSETQTSEIVSFLGGADNILKYEAKISRLNVYVKDSSLVDIDAINEVTGCGVLLVNDKVQLILKEDTETMNNILNDLKMRD